jgi:c-di-GMP-binding flagellar brake protein YcgR
MSKGDERRRWPRIPVRGEIVGQIYTETAAPLLDLSEGGALLEVPCVLRPRANYTLRLALGQGAVLMLRASVVRSYAHHLEAIGHGESRLRYHAALQFVNVSERERELIRLRLAGDASLAGALGVRLKPLPDAGPAAVQVPPPAEEPDPLLSAHWPPGDDPVERRDSTRVHIDGRVEGEVGLLLESRVLTLSQGGMLVFAPELGTALSCSLQIAGQTIKVRGVVRNAHKESPDANASHHVVGLEFLELEEQARSCIERFLATSSPPAA